MANPITGKATVAARQKTNLFIYDNFQEDNSKKTTFNDIRHYKIYFLETMKNCVAETFRCFYTAIYFFKDTKFLICAMMRPSPPSCKGTG